MISTAFRRTAGVVLGALLIAGCDLSGLESAGDDFDLIIELQEINTTVAAQVLAYDSLEPIGGAELAFSGQHAGTIIDVYSDPISVMRASEGVVTFGIENAVVPTVDGPVEFGITAQAEGYLTERIDVALADSGGNNVTIRLVPDRVNTSLEGTAGVENGQTEASEESGVQESVTVETPQINNVLATASVTVGLGTRPLGADGMPLSGKLTTELQVFDLDEGLDAVPAQLMTDQESSLLGVAAFGISDGGGRMAFDFEAGGSGKVQECAFSMTNKVENEELYAAIEAGDISEAHIVVSALDAEEDVDVGSIPFTLGERPSVIATVCVGGTNANVDLTPVREAAAAHGKAGGADWNRYRRSWWSYRSPPVPMSTEQTITVDNSANGAPHTINAVRIEGMGRSRIFGSGFRVPGGASVSKRYATALPAGRQGRIILELANGERVTDTFIVSNGPQARTIQLPSSEAQQYTVKVSLACPSGQKLSPQVTEKSFSGLSLGSRPLGKRVQFADMGKAQNIQVTESSVSASAVATLVPGTTYEFRAMYDSSLEIRQATAPTGSNAVSFDVNPSDISGISCE